MKQRRQRTCASCGKPLGGTLAECHECASESYGEDLVDEDGNPKCDVSYRAGGRRVSMTQDGWETTYNGFLWKAQWLGVKPMLLNEVYDD
jgi:hypothetical protein